MIRFEDKSWVKVPQNPVDKPFDTWRDPVSGYEKLSYMEEYDNFEEADEAADAWFEKNGCNPQEIGKKMIYVWLINRKVGSFLQARDLENAIVDDCVLVQYRTFKELHVLQELVKDDDGEYVPKKTRYEKVFSCLVKKEEEEEECDECRLVPRTED